MKLPSFALITEVGPRDGLQNEQKYLPTEQKVKLINALSRTGLKRIQAASFVHPKAIPQMRDAAEVMASIDRVPGVLYEVIVPNLVGAQRALEARVDRIGLFVSASETHNRHNVNMSVEESLQGFVPIVELCHKAGVPVFAGLSTAFGCPYEGTVPQQRVISLVRQLLAMGVSEIFLGDTTGMGNPKQVVEMVDRFFGEFPTIPLNLHFHDTRGMGLANILVALQRGVTMFDASVGGLGGCPYAPGATGNVCTEDVVHMLHEIGVETGIDLDKLIACSRMAQGMVGRELPSRVLKAGKRSDLVAATH